MIWALTKYFLLVSVLLSRNLTPVTQTKVMRTIYMVSCNYNVPRMCGGEEEEEDQEEEE